VKLTVSPAAGGWNPDHPVLKHAPAVVSFEVSDSGIRHPAGKSSASSSRPFNRRMRAPAANTAAPV